MSAKHLKLVLPVDCPPQPDDVTCGPTSLSAVLRFYGLEHATVSVVAEATPRNPDGGTLAPHLGRAARAFGFGVRARPLALQVFDPTWRALSPAELTARLAARTAALPEGRLRRVHEAWLAYLEVGGEVILGELSNTEFVSILERGHPIIAGLSITWLYQQARELPQTNSPDDVHGSPVGHFVVVCGYDDGGESYLVADPWPHPPFPGDEETGTYKVDRRRLRHAILLGDATHDAVILEVLPPGASG